jgi:P4 family phage/plasmid primase-like protien
MSPRPLDLLGALWPAELPGASLHLWRKNSRTEWFPVTEAGLAELAGRAAKLHGHVYWSVCAHDRDQCIEAAIGAAKAKAEEKGEDPAKAAAKAATYARGIAEACVAIPGLWLDLDISDWKADAAKKRYPAEQVARDMLASLPLPPSAMVYSGGGLYPLWLFDEPANLAEHRDLPARWTAHLRGRLNGYDLDATGDLARVLRMPGTLNVRYDPPRRCEVVELHAGRRYNPDDFVELIEIAETEQQRPPKTKSRSSSQNANGTGAALSDPQVLDLANGAKNADKFQRLMAGDTGGYQSASEAHLALLRILAFYTRDPDQIDRLFRLSGLAEHEKWDRPDYRDRTITKALAVVTAPYSPIGTIGEPEGENLTDLGNARRFVRQHGADVRYCHPWGKWLVWDGHRWVSDKTAAVHRLAKRTLTSIYGEAEAEKDADRRKEIAKWAMKSESYEAITGLLKLAASEDGIPVLTEQLDQNQWLLNCQNGTLDLRTGELRAHRREDYITRCIPVVYDHEAICPTWEGFVDRIFSANGELIAFVRRAIGYALTGSTREHVFFILWGTGANGKSTLLIVLIELLGEYAGQAAPDLLLAKTTDRHPTEIADLFGKRLVAAVETGEGRRLAEALVKQMTGGDRMKARRMREDFWEFSSSHKLFLATNHKPIIRSTDHAMWRRIRLIPFAVQIPEQEQDKDLADKLKAELPGILAWAVRGCLDWQRSGLGTADAVEKATASYREEQDILGAFIEECCIVGPDGAQAGATQLYNAYKQWCERGGERPLTQTGFGNRLVERGFRKGRNTATGRMEYHGIGVVTEQSEESEDFFGINGSSTTRARDDPEKVFRPFRPFSQDPGEAGCEDRGPPRTSQSEADPYANEERWAIQDENDDLAGREGAP